VILGREQGADVPVEHEAGLHPALERLLDRWIGGVDEVPHPGGQIRCCHSGKASM
jgi:hypothetical protein